MAFKNLGNQTEINEAFKNKPLIVFLQQRKSEIFKWTNIFFVL